MTDYDEKKWNKNFPDYQIVRQTNVVRMEKI